MATVINGILSRKLPWTLVLLGMGTAAVAGVKRGSGYIAVFGWWAIIVLFGVGIAAVRG